MNWKTYQKLTQEQREEWKFKFKDKGKFIPSIFNILWIAILWCVSFLYMGFSLIILERFPQYQFQVIDLFVRAIEISEIYILIFIIYVVVCLIIYIIESNKEDKFLRKCLKD